MHVTGSSQSARVRRAICACLGGIMLAGLFAACGESNRYAHLAPTPEPTAVVIELLAMAPAGRTMPPVEPSPPPRPPDEVPTIAPPTPTPTPTPTPDGTMTPTPTARPTGPLTPEEIGRQIFVDNACAVCHGEDLSGGIGPALAGRTPEDLTDDRIRSQIGTGGNGMPFFENLTAEQIDQLRAFIRSS